MNHQEEEERVTYELTINGRAPPSEVVENLVNEEERVAEEWKKLAVRGLLAIIAYGAMIYSLFN